ncbi:MAG: hypothetical protein ACKVU4_08410 [Phycisphaerales bacterium]
MSRRALGERYVHSRGLLAVAAIGIACAVLPGCSGARGTGPAFDVPAAEFAAAFAAAKGALVDASFELDRVDARAGVITTVPKPTSGLATPWDGEQSSLGQEFEDLLNRHYRRVRVTFEPAGAEGAGGAVPADLRAGGVATRCTVSVTIDRIRRPGWRVETSSIRLSSTSLDPEIVQRGMSPQYAVPMARDDRLARRLASSIERALPPSGAVRNGPAGVTRP